MVNEIEFLVCDSCNTVMHAAGEVYMCLECEKPMKRVKFTRQPTKRAVGRRGTSAKTDENPRRDYKRYKNGVRQPRRR